MRRAEQNLEALVKALEEVSANNIQARVEEDSGVFYVYNAQDGTFLAQGRTLTELRERLEQRWPDAVVAVTEGDTAVLERLKATTDATA
jgi:vancomycin resistance protein YoaR